MKNPVNQDDVYLVVLIQVRCQFHVSTVTKIQPRQNKLMKIRRASRDQLLEILISDILH